VLLAFAVVIKNKLKNIKTRYFIINVFYTISFKKKSPPTELGEIYISC
jgi:hypothetical protein